MWRRTLQKMRQYWDSEPVGVLLFSALVGVGILLLFTDPPAFFQVLLITFLFVGYYGALLSLARLIGRTGRLVWLWYLALLLTAGGAYGVISGLFLLFKQGVSSAVLTVTLVGAVGGYLLAGVLYFWLRRTRKKPKEEAPHG